MSSYNPSPKDNTKLELSADLVDLTESLAKNVHDVWSKSRLDDGWVFGEERNDSLKTHNCLIPYEELPEIEKNYDRKTAIETIKLILSLGYEIKKK